MTPKKLWQVLRSALHSSPEAVLLSHESKKGLADRFVTFFSDKIDKIRNSFSSSDSFTLPPPPDVPNFSCFKQVPQEEIRKNYHEVTHQILFVRPMAYISC